MTCVFEANILYTSGYACHSMKRGTYADSLMNPAKVQRGYLGAVHDCVASVELVGIVQLSQALLCEVIPAVHDPPAQQWCIHY